jgi:class 3 adenylate cyclase
MFAELIGPTPLLVRMDPENLREIISGDQKSVPATVQRFEGYFAKYIGDRALVYFGYPQAQCTG